MISPAFTVLDFSIQSLDGGIQTGFHSIVFAERRLIATGYSSSTITELIYVPDHVPDGEYLLNLQIAPFNADASPSRPIIFPIDN